MALIFDETNSQNLKISPVGVTTRPLTIGIWAWDDTGDGSTRIICSFGDNTRTNAVRNVLTIASNNAAAGFGIESTASGTTTNAFATLNGFNWQFILARFISATNDWIDVYAPWGGGAGQAANANRTTSSTPGTAFNELRFGSTVCSDTPTNFLSGQIAEFWYAKTDLSKYASTSAALTTAPRNLLRQLAWGGPFSIPGLANDLVEYRSFRSGYRFFPSDGDYTCGRTGTAFPLVTPSSSLPRLFRNHPPLPYNFVRGTQRKQIILG